jgi:hypothetical protein
MSVAADHLTVSLWPLNTPPVAGGTPRRRKDPSTDPLAAITSRYRRGRAGIIAGETPPVVATHLPTVPVAVLPSAAPPPAPPPVAAGETPTFWARFGRSRRRGRHSATI